MKKILITAMVMLMFAPLALAECGAEIKGITYNPRPAISGKPVTINATIEFKGPCEYLVEAGIVPQDVPLFLLATVNPSQPIQCCPGNENFQAKYVKVECEWWEFGGCSKTETIVLEPKAPAEGFCDHCAGQYGDTNPTCEEDPNFYYRGPGTYLAYVGVFKGCYFDLASKGEQQQTYDLNKFTIDVKAPSLPSKPEEEDIWTKIKNFLTQQILGPLTMLDLLVLIATLGIIIYIVV